MARLRITFLLAVGSAPFCTSWGSSLVHGTAQKQAENKYEGGFPNAMQ